MSEPWAADFSYDRFRLLVDAAAAWATVAPVSAARDGLTVDGRPLLCLRHDVDVSLGRAVDLAEVEADLGVAATYMVMTSAALYDVESAESRAHLAALVDLGHEIGLHFDAVADGGDADAPVDVLERQLHRACERLSDAAGAPTASLSFHRPQPQFLRGPLLVAGRVNAYAAELMEGYISDSAGRFREGDPLARLGPDGTPPVRQLLVHPIWWGPAHEAPGQRLESFYRAEVAGSGADEARSFDDRLASSLPGVRRSGAAAPEQEG